MELIVAEVVAILGKVAIDKGEGFLKEAGKAAADAARELYDTILGRLREDPSTTVIAEGFRKKPEGYKQPVEDALKEQLEADPALEATVRALLEKLKAATPPETYSILVSGSGAVAIGGSKAVGAGGNLADEGSVIVSGGSVSGSVGRPSEDAPP